MDAQMSYLRKHPRFEPPLVDAIIKIEDESEIRGRVLDSSCGGMAIALPEKTEVPSADTMVLLSVADANSDRVIKKIGEATIKRSWSANGTFENEKGVSLEFYSALTGDDLHRLCLHGIQQKTRLTSQDELAKVDIDYLGDCRRDLITCQMKLFSLSLTVGVALAGAYFGLIYHSVATNQLFNQSLSFWRAMVASLPGCLAIGCSLMVAHKSISVQRIDAYLLLLKQWTIKKQYPREYKGWESEYSKYRNVLNSNTCLSCKASRKCGELSNEDQKKLKEKSLYQTSIVDLYHIVMYIVFFSAFGLSIVAIVGELLGFQHGGPVHMAIGSGITLCILAAGAALFYVFYHLRKGRYSNLYFRRCWIDLLNRCRWS